MKETVASQSTQWIFSTGTNSSIYILLTLMGGIGVAFAAWLIIKWFRRPMGERLQTVFNQRDEIVLLLHPDPDPDAMASAMGLAHLAEAVDTEVTIQYSGQIRHQENRVFRNILDPELDRISHIDELATDEVVLVDHNTPRGFKGAEKIMPFAVIDHHPGNGSGLDFTDKRTEYGSCASIVTEYLQDVDQTPVPPEGVDEVPDQVERTGDQLPPTVTTGLMYGIYSDTNRLTGGCISEDFEAASYLCEGVDETLLDRIANPEVDTEILEIKSRAIENRTERGSFIVSNVGPVNNGDAIPQAADELIQLEGVTAAVVYGERNDSFRVSGRSRDDRVHMGDALNAIANDVPDASAGGHARMGGGQFPAQTAVTDGGTNAEAEEGVRPSELDDLLFTALEGDI